MDDPIEKKWSMAQITQKSAVKKKETKAEMRGKRVNIKYSISKLENYSRGGFM